MHSTTRFFRRLESALGTVVGALYLLALYAFAFWLVVGSLSAIQVRDSMVEENLPFSFNQFESARDWLTRAEDRIYADLQRKDVLWDLQKDQRFKLALIARNFGQVGGEPAVDYWDPEAMPSFQKALVECGAAPADGRPTMTACDDLFSYYDLKRRINAVLEGNFVESISKSEQDALGLLQQQRSLSNFVDVNRFFRTLEYDFFLNAPRQILVMLLTISMGFLGSVITMTWTFVRRESVHSVRRFLLLPFVGAMSAFIVLIFLKAGQLTLTAGDTTDELSPFVLSFVGIISGLLSERAYGRISEVGQSFFRVEARADRWGIRLKAALAAAGVSIDDVARHLGIDTGDAAEIVEGRASANPAQQQLIAALVRAEPRELFTDIAPVDAAVKLLPPAEGPAPATP